MFLDHRWVLFGAVRDDSVRDADHPQTFLEIVDPTDPTRSTKLELGKSVMQPSRSCIFITLRSGAGHEGNPVTGSGGIPFVSDASRGSISVEVHFAPGCGNFNTPLLWGIHAFILDIEDILRKVPSPSNKYVGLEDVSRYLVVFSCDRGGGPDWYRILSRHPFVVGFRYASVVGPLDPENPKGPRCFYIYDFNPYRESSEPITGPGLEDPDPETGYPKGASEITREVVGGLGCWKARFDVPPAEGDIERCSVALTNSGVVLFEVCGLTSLRERLLW